MQILSVEGGLMVADPLDAVSKVDLAVLAWWLIPDVERRVLLTLAEHCLGIGDQPDESRAWTADELIAQCPSVPPSRVKGSLHVLYQRGLIVPARHPDLGLRWVPTILGDALARALFDLTPPPPKPPRWDKGVIL